MKSLLNLIHLRGRTKSKSSKSSKSNSPPSSPKPTSPLHIRRVSDEIKYKMFSPFSKLLRPRTPTRTSQEKQPSTPTAPPTPTKESRFKTPLRAPGGPLSSNPVNENDIPIWARKGNKEVANNATSQTQVNDNDARGYEVGPSNTERSPHLPKIAKIERLSLVLRDNTVLQAPDDEDEIKVIRKRAASFGGPRAFGLSPYGLSNVGEEAGFMRHARASTYDFGTKPPLYDSQLYTSENGESKHSIPETPLSPSTTAAKPLPSSSPTTPPATSSRVSSLVPQHFHAPQTPSTPLSAEADSRVVPLVTPSIQTPFTPQCTHSTQTPSSSPCDHSTQNSSAPLSQEPKQESEEEKKVEERVVVVGISGISGSGKSTLAYLLNEIFNPETDEEKASGIRPQRIISQDNFFKPKRDCPRTTFIVTGEADKAFAWKSLSEDHSGPYDIQINPEDLSKGLHAEDCDQEESDEEKSGDRAVVEKVREERNEEVHVEGSPPKLSTSVDTSDVSTPTPRAFVAPIGPLELSQLQNSDTEENDDKESSDRAVFEENSVDEEDEKERSTPNYIKSFIVVGPDTDCESAFDFEALEKAVRDLKERGEVVSVSEWKTRVARKPRAGKLGIVKNTGDGIFSYSSILGSSISKANRKRSAGVAELEGGTASQAKAQPKTQHVENLSSLKAQHHDLITELRQRVQNSFSKMSVKVRFVFVEGMLLYTNPSSPSNTRTRLQSHIQIPLYLPTFFPEAKSRRLSRPIYTEGRLPGQMWKTEAYFDEVVCRNFKEEHGWLEDSLKGAGMNAARGMNIIGIHARGIGEYNIEDGVRWAFGKIMYENLCGDF